MAVILKGRNASSLLKSMPAFGLVSLPSKSLGSILIIDK